MIVSNLMINRINEKKEEAELRIEYSPHLPLAPIEPGTNISGGSSTEEREQVPADISFASRTEITLENESVK